MNIKRRRQERTRKERDTEEGMRGNTHNKKKKDGCERE